MIKREFRRASQSTKTMVLFVWFIWSVENYFLFYVIRVITRRCKEKMSTGSMRIFFFMDTHPREMNTQTYVLLQRTNRRSRSSNSYRTSIFSLIFLVFLGLRINHCVLLRPGNGILIRLLILARHKVFFFYSLFWEFFFFYFFKEICTIEFARLLLHYGFAVFEVIEKINQNSNERTRLPI